MTDNVAEIGECVVLKSGAVEYMVKLSKSKGWNPSKAQYLSQTTYSETTF